MHGGAQGSGGPKGARNGNYKHGRYTAEAIASRRWLRKTIREVRALVDLSRLPQFRGGRGDGRLPIFLPLACTLARLCD